MSLHPSLAAVRHAVRRGLADLEPGARLVVACSGGRTVRPLRMAVTESSGDFTFSLEEPVREVACVERDYRRSPSDPTRFGTGLSRGIHPSRR